MKIFNLRQLLVFGLVVIVNLAAISSVDAGDVHPLPYNGVGPAAISPSVFTGSEVYFPTGTYLFSETDLKIAARSIPIEWTRTYRSNRIIITGKYSSGTSSYSSGGAIALGGSSSGSSGGAVSYSSTSSSSTTSSSSGGTWAFALPEDGPLGYGWYTPFTEKMAGDTFVSEDGRVTVFNKDSNGNYITDMSTGLSLKKTTDGYELKKIGGNTKYFNSQGKLISYYPIHELQEFHASLVLCCLRMNSSSRYFKCCKQIQCAMTSVGAFIATNNLAVISFDITGCSLQGLNAWLFIH